MVARRSVHLAGLLLWRGGLLLVGGYSLFHGARTLVRLVALPWELEVGLALGLAGLALVMASLVAERIVDARREGELAE